MSARLIHVGEDHWHRLQVLRAGGLFVDQCRDVRELTHTLRTGTDPYGVLLAASPMFDPASAVEIIRSATKCPVILFATELIVPERQQYDLIVDPFTDPKDWLDDIWSIVDRTEQILADSRTIRQVGAQLKQDCAQATLWSREQRARARQLARYQIPDPLRPDSK